LIFGRSYWRTIESGMEREWLVTNGIGGFASSTVCGANARRYHGLLVASLRPPVERRLVLSKIDESVFIDGEAFNLYSHKTQGGCMGGYRFQESFRAFPVPEFCYRVKDVFIKKKVCMVRGENTSIITYEIYNGKDKAMFRLTPLVNFRDHHHCSRRAGMFFTPEIRKGVLRITPYGLPCTITIHCSTGGFKSHRDNWFMGMYYPLERERGLDHTEDHYIPGSYDIEVEPYKFARIAIKASIEVKPDDRDGFALMAAEEKRILGLQKKQVFDDEFGMILVTAADAFIVHRKSTGSKTILAGYPWFADWGRDAMIALPGLTLATGRFDDARDVLYTFCRHIRNGLIPNMFPDEGGKPAYNSVDASLWFFEAVAGYVEHTGDTSFLREELFPAMEAILHAYRQGTMFNIHMDRDFLIYAGDKDTQLTWMDAIAGDRVVTPRWGKAVEVNALWYNALCVMADCCKRLGINPGYYTGLAGKVQKSFIDCFVNGEHGGLYDVVTPGGPDSSIRPNQVIAAGLTYPVVTPGIAEKMIKMLWDRLYTPYGMRSLSPDSPMYKGVYTGSVTARDWAYHQGTVWPWLLAPFIKALITFSGFGKDSTEKARGILLPLMDHLNDACIGFISEIFDGDYPFYPRGCFAQAWSVAALLQSKALLSDERHKR
jgi:predicted glycogen debranching enzyme